MFRLILFVLFLCAAAFGFSYLADRPGSVAIDWFGTRIETTAFIASVALVFTIIVSIGVWQFIRFLIHGPEAMQLFFRTRRREKGLAAVGRGLVAVGAGDTKTALRAAEDAQRHLGHDPMALLLASQAAQLAGDRTTARATFERMLQAPETRPLGLRGLYVEAQRAEDAEAARRFAEAAVATRPGIPWAANAVLAFQAGAREWDAALATIRSNADNRLIDRAHAKRLRAVVLTAMAIEAEGRDRAGAKALAREANNLAPDLVPAAELAARLMSETGDVRGATKIIETTWRMEPHPDLAEAYTHARMGDAARDRLKRARALADLAPHHPESRLVVAGAAMEARDFAEARRALAPLAERPTRRHCLMMAAIAEAEDNIGEAREWLGRAARAAPDPAWTADGYVSDRWLPVSPVTAKLDAFQWRAPVEAAPGAAIPSVPVPVIPAPIGVDAPPLLPKVDAVDAEPVPEPPAPIRIAGPAATPPAPERAAPPERASQPAPAPTPPSPPPAAVAPPPAPPPAVVTPPLPPPVAAPPPPAPVIAAPPPPPPRPDTPPAFLSAAPTPDTPPPPREPEAELIGPALAPAPSSPPPAPEPAPAPARSWLFGKPRAVEASAPAPAEAPKEVTSEAPKPAPRELQAQAPVEKPRLAAVVSAPPAPEPSPVPAPETAAPAPVAAAPATTSSWLFPKPPAAASEAPAASPRPSRDPDASGPAPAAPTPPAAPPASLSSWLFPSKRPAAQPTATAADAPALTAETPPVRDHAPAEAEPPAPPAPPKSSWLFPEPRPAAPAAGKGPSPAAEPGAPSGSAQPEPARDSKVVRLPIVPDDPGPEPVPADPPPAKRRFGLF
jgi:HemY protein